MCVTVQLMQAPGNTEGCGGWMWERSLEGQRCSEQKQSWCQRSRRLWREGESRPRARTGLDFCLPEITCHVVLTQHMCTVRVKAGLKMCDRGRLSAAKHDVTTEVIMVKAEAKDELPPRELLFSRPFPDLRCCLLWHCVFLNKNYMCER